MVLAYRSNAGAVLRVINRLLIGLGDSRYSGEYN